MIYSIVCSSDRGIRFMLKTAESQNVKVFQVDSRTATVDLSDKIRHYDVKMFFSTLQSLKRHQYKITLELAKF